MDQLHDDSREEQQIADLLATAKGELPPPDRDFLARLRDESTAVFLNSQPPAPPPARRRIWSLRMLCLTTAAAVLVALVLSPPSSTDRSMADVLRTLEDARTLHLEKRGIGPAAGKFRTVAWVRQPGDVRADIDSQGTAKTLLITGGRRWNIDEAANRATSTPHEVSRSEAIGMFLAAVDVNDPSAAETAAVAWKRFLQQRPTSKLSRADEEIALYDFDAGQSWRFRAEVDTRTGMLRFLEVVGPNTGYRTQILAFNEPIPGEKFTVKETLTEDGRIGKVTDAQGIVTIKPVLAGRWTPVCGPLLLKPGDWLRTDVRGANAVELRLVKDTKVILGPGTLAEFKSPTDIRLHYGEIEVTAPDKPAVELIAGMQKPITLKGRALYRLQPGSDELVRVEKDPPWLAGFKGVRPQESIGSLVANIDGRNTPLTVGYHKVTVEIRDQIARTTVEESFVNHTLNTLEGVFHFPLPQDASISGFGMWIGNELVEADVVEKQRAREIYETILRERRDPGLLEWAGGNLFKARVFPIFPRSEKRIKITYTQVLPLVGNQYRYSYALQSELLKQHPLRELSIDVKLSSLLPIKQVSSPTHTARVDRTDHAAHVEFSAQGYTPTRDFEVLVETAAAENVAVIPHRRGDDGYFMLLLQPPAAEGTWQRELLPRSKPLKLLLLADTSASLDRQQRQEQEAFVAALCASLIAEDQVNLACCDVTCDWAFDAPQPATEENISRLSDHLSGRRSLGWTDLDRAFATALAQADAQTHVVYIGDGSITTGDADPQAFVRRLERLHEGHKAALHAVSVGSLYEASVLRGIAALGGGSMRRIGGDRTPQLVALELLKELAQPGLRDIKLEFHGVRVARVYPERLPNVAAGTQQVVLGRYLPEGQDQQGEVVVTARRGDEEVRYRAPIVLKDAEQGNSFIPRLWARQHLDALLEQGSSEEIRQQVIALSEEYHIITPYTSLLVLESDEDRRRFKVQRRFQMRDGERFFQEGTDRATFALKQQQMQRAADWRLELRLAVLSDLARAGRHAWWYTGGWGFGRSSSMGGAFAGGFGAGGAFGGSGGFGQSHELLGNINGVALDALLPINGPIGESSPIYGLDRKTLGVDSERMLVEALELYDQREKRESASRELDEANLGASFKPGLSQFSREEPNAMAADWDGVLSGLSSTAFEGKLATVNLSLSSHRLSLVAGVGEMAKETIAGEYFATGRVGGFLRSRIGPDPGSSTVWVNELFQPVPAPARPRDTANKEKWPEEARKLADSLLRHEKLRALEGGLELNRQTETLNLRWNEVNWRSQQRELVSADAWLVRSGGGASQELIQWCDGRERGIYSEAFQLGRQRASQPADLEHPPLDLHDYSLAPLYVSYPGYRAEVRPEADARQRLVLQSLSSDRYAMHFIIDTARNVVLAMESFRNDKPAGAIRFSQFIQAGGMWWATKIESFDDQDRRHTLTTQTVKELTGDEFTDRMRQELAGRANVQLLPQPLPTLSAAKRAQQDGEAALADHFTLLLHFASGQQWPRVNEHLAECQRLAAGKPGMRWVELSVLSVSRRHEELRKRLVSEAEQLALPPANDRLAANESALADHVLRLAAHALPPHETLAVLRLVRPVYQRQPEYRQAMKHWRRQELQYVNNTGEPDRAGQLYRQLAADYPRDVDLQREYANFIANQGNYEAAFAWLEQVLEGPVHWLPSEESTLREAYARLLENQGRYDRLVEFLKPWIERKPESETAYALYLSALVKSGHLDEAHALVLQWLREGRQKDELPQDVQSRLRAAVHLATGQGHGLRTHRVEPEFEDPLAETALSLARHKTQWQMANHIMNSLAFPQTDAGRRVRGQVFQWLLDDESFAELNSGQIAMLVAWVTPYQHEATSQQWRELARRIEDRWKMEEDDGRRHGLGQALAQLLVQRVDVREQLAFLRLQADEGPEAYRTTYAQQLFDTLVTQPWEEKLEAESFDLIPRTSASDTPALQLFSQLPLLHRWADAMVQARYVAGVKAIERPEDLTRTQLQQKQQELLTAARQGVADRLQRAAAESERPWADWLRIEQLYLDLQLDRNLEQTAASAWEYLGPQPRPLEADPEQPTTQFLAVVLRDRYLATLANLAVRPKAEAQLIDRLLEYIDRAQSEESENVQYWRLWKARLLVGLDRPQQLAEELQRWIPDDPLSQWRLALGYLLAEQGSLEPAIKLFEGVELADELPPGAYRTLADWYLALGKREDYERAMIRSYGTIPEWQLSNLLNKYLAPWRNSAEPSATQLDEHAILIFRALFAKSENPQSYIWQLREAYQSTRDFRVLAVLADAVVGHSAGKVYPLLQQVDNVLRHVHEEATADSLVERIGQVRARAKSPVDARALDLLEMQIERRAAELLNQPGPHTARALAALRKAFDHDWTEGEPRLMADMLSGLGRISQPELAAEQLRQLEALDRRREESELDRLRIARSLARAYWSYERHDAAIDHLEAALRGHVQATGGVLMASANDAMHTLVTLLKDRRQFLRGERLLLEQLAHPEHVHQHRWLTQQLFELYREAIRHQGETSLGKGQQQFAAVTRKLQEELQAKDPNYVYQLVELLCQIYRVAHIEAKLEGVPEDLEAFAFKRLPSLLEQQTNQYENVVGRVASTLYELSGVRKGLEFLIVRIEEEPAWLPYNDQDGWSRHAGNLARWRQEVKMVGDLEPRLLAIVLEQLKRDLSTRQQRNRHMYHSHYSYFWSEKADAFARAAEEVLRQHKQSVDAVKYIAGYFDSGLRRTARAVAILEDAHAGGLLDEPGIYQLVGYLHKLKRYGRSIELLVPLVEKQPSNLDYRISLMEAYFKNQQPDELAELVDQTDEHFHKDGLWIENVLARLAYACVECELYQRAVDYYDELIPLHERTHPGRGIGQGTLSEYYRQLAFAYAGLGQTAKAVEAACGAVVSWGPRHERRAEALYALDEVLRKSPDLDAYVQELDKASQESGLHNPLARKALGKIYLEKQQPAKAAAQLKLALELQPGDVETHQQLLEAYDRQNDAQSAVEALYEAVQLQRRQLDLYSSLGDRLTQLEKPQEAERAYTSIVEMQPLESESHTMLAEIRQGQDRWDEAIEHWRRVAEIRSLEPTGLLKLAEALIHQKQWDDALQTLQKLRARTWPERFGDQTWRIRQLEDRIPKDRRQRNAPRM